MRKEILLVLLMAVVGFATTASADTLAYWRFDDVGDPDIGATVAAGNAMPDSDGQSVWRKAVNDHSGNGNHMTSWDYSWAGFVWSADVPSNIVPLTGAANDLCMKNTGNYPSMFTWSEQSLPSGVDIEAATPAQFTVEASFKADSLTAYHTIVGRDDRYVATIDQNLAAFYFQVIPNKAVAVKFADVQGYWHEAVSDADAVMTGQWYNMVAVSDGSTLTLYLNNEVVKQTDMTLSGSGDTSMILGNSSGGDWESGTWTVGRGMYAGGHGDRWYGRIDEVRISDSALAPSEFLFVPEPATMMILGLGALVTLRRRRQA